MRGLFRAFLSSSERSLENIVRWRLEWTDTSSLFCSGTPTGTCLSSISGGRCSSKPGEISSMITGLFSSQQSKTQISFKHLESLSFPKRESSTASVGRMFSTVLTGECLVNNDNYTKGWKVSFNSPGHKGPSVKSSDLKRWM